MLTSLRYASKGLDLATGTFEPEIVSQLPAGPQTTSTALATPSSIHAGVHPPELASFPHPAASTSLAPGAGASTQPASLHGPKMTG